MNFQDHLNGFSKMRDETRSSSGNRSYKKKFMNGGRAASLPVIKNQNGRYNQVPTQGIKNQPYGQEHKLQTENLAKNQRDKIPTQWATEDPNKNYQRKTKNLNPQLNKPINTIGIGKNPNDYYKSHKKIEEPYINHDRNNGTHSPHKKIRNHELDEQQEVNVGVSNKTPSKRTYHPDSVSKNIKRSSDPSKEFISNLRSSNKKEKNMVFLNSKSSKAKELSLAEQERKLKAEEKIKSTLQKKLNY